MSGLVPLLCLSSISRKGSAWDVRVDGMTTEQEGSFSLEIFGKMSMLFSV